MENSEQRLRVRVRVEEEEVDAALGYSTEKPD